MAGHRTGSYLGSDSTQPLLQLPSFSGTDYTSSVSYPLFTPEAWSNTISLVTVSRRRRSWIWAHTSLPDMCGGSNHGSSSRWNCAYCVKSYKECSGTSKPMQHLESAHGIRRPAQRGTQSTPQTQPSAPIDYCDYQWQPDYFSFKPICAEDSPGSTPLQSSNPVPPSGSDQWRRPSRSWIWSHTAGHMAGEVDRDQLGRRCWRCLYCGKTYQNSSGTRKPMLHLERAHSVKKEDFP